MKRIFLSIRLIIIGKRLERCREKLKKLYSSHEPNDSHRMKCARDHFNHLCNRWDQAEAQLLDIMK